MYDELVKRLREAAEYVPCIMDREDAIKAADAIEELQGWNNTLSESVAMLTKQIAELSKRVPKTPHGRLIDADALAEHKFVCIPKVTINGKDAGSAYRLGWNSAIEAIMENAETIIGGE